MDTTNTSPDKISKLDGQKLEFEKALSIRQFEIDLFWKRAWFFGALVLALLTVEMTLKSSGHFKLGACLSFVVFWIALIQTLMNRGSKYWQERYEFKTKNRESLLGIDVTKTEKIPNEKYLIDANILLKGDSFFTRAHRFSISKLTFLVWDIITIFLFGIWLYDFGSLFFPNFLSSFKKYNSKIDPLLAVIFLFHLIVVVYIIVYWVKGRVYEKPSKKDEPDDKSSEFYKDAKSYINLKEILSK